MNMKSYKKWIILILAMSPLIDILYTVLYNFMNIEIPIQQVIRICIVGYLFFSIKENKSKYIILAIFTLLMLGQGYMIFNKYDYDLMSNFSFILKIMNLFSIIFYIIEKLNCEYITLEEVLNALNISAIILSTNILISNIFKVGLKTYNYGNRLGYKGFIEAHNDVTVVLLILLPLSIYQYMKSKKKYNLIVSIIMAISLILIGPKAGKVLLLVEFIIIGSVYLVRIFNIRVYISKMKGILSFIFILLGLFTYINFQEIKFELNEVANSKGYRSIYSYVVSYRDIQPILIDNSIGSKYDIHPKYKFGMGYYYANKILHEEKKEFYSIENDFDGLIYYTGIFTATCILWIIFNMLWKIIKNRKKDDILTSFIILSLVIGVIHSFLGGHVIYSAISNTYFGAIIGLGYFKSVGICKKVTNVKVLN